VVGGNRKFVNQTPVQRGRARVPASAGLLLADLQHPVTKYLLNYAPMPTTISAACWAVIGRFVIEAASDLPPTGPIDAQNVVVATAQFVAWQHLGGVPLVREKKPLTASSGLRRSRG
jgi:hypothetical protein